MFVPSRRAANEEMMNAIFDYLNLNRHKFDHAGEFRPTANRRDYIPARLTRPRPDGPSGDNATTHQTTMGEPGFSQTLAKAGACTLEVLPELALAGSLVGVGQPILQKPFVVPKSARRTSIASKYLAPLIPGELPTRVWTPRPGHSKAFTKSLGRAVARWIPGVGWALLAHDAYQFADCMLRPEQKIAPNS